MEIEQDFVHIFSNLHNKYVTKLEIFISILIQVKTSRKAATAKESVVAKGKDLVANATVLVAISSPAKYVQ